MIRSFILILGCLFFSISASEAGAQETGDNGPQDKKVIVCSTTQVADFARQVVGDRWEVICVLGPGEDPHNYSPGNDDLNSVKRADLCAQNGWHLEGGEWMKNMADSASKPLVTCVANVTEITLEENGQTVKDPHAWFNPANAWIYVKNLRDAISKIDPENAEEYAARADMYRLQLLALDRWIERQISTIKKGKVLVTHHDAFGYFSQKYGFKASSPLGWSTSDLSSITLNKRQAIIKEINELGVKSIFVETSINPKVLNDIARDAGVKIGGRLYSDAMGKKGSAGETYLGMMRENVLTIVRALK